jgi:hypothetical protein
MLRLSLYYTQNSESFQKLRPACLAGSLTGIFSHTGSWNFLASRKTQKNIAGLSVFLLK